MTNKNFPLTYNQTITKVSWPLGLKNLNNEYKCQKIQMYKCQKIQRIQMSNVNTNVKCLADIPFNLETIK